MRQLVIENSVDHEFKYAEYRFKDRFSKISFDKKYSKFFQLQFKFESLALFELPTYQINERKITQCDDISLIIYLLQNILRPIKKKLIQELSAL